MAVMSIRVVRDIGGTTTASATIADADITRIVSAHQTLLGVATPQAVLQYFLDRIVKQMVANAKMKERAAVVVPDIPVT